MLVLRFAPVYFAFVSAAIAATNDGSVTQFGGSLSRTFTLTAGQTSEVAVGLPSPSKLPPNGRIAVEFAGYRKVLHALDPDFYMVYRAPENASAAVKIS